MKHLFPMVLLCASTAVYATNDITMPPPVHKYVKPVTVNNANATSVSTSKASAAASARQAQGQLQRQTQTLSNVSSPNVSAVASTGPYTATTSDSNNATQTVVQAESRRPVSTAYAPSIGATADCTTSVGLGLSGVGASGSFGASSVNENCERRALATVAAGFGDMNTAEEILCDDDKYRNARQRTGRPCAKVELTPEQKAIYSGNDNVVRARYKLPLAREDY